MARASAWLVVLTALALLAASPLVAQDGASADGDARDTADPDVEAAGGDEDGTDDDFFADPFAVDDDPAADDGDDESGAAADESSNDDAFAGDDFDSLFEDEDMIDTADEEQMVANPQDDLLETEGVEWGGRIRGSLTADWGWDDAWTSDFAFDDPTSDSLTPTIGADLTFDARPDPEFRAFGKLKIETTDDGGITGLDLGADTIDTSALPAGWTAEEDENGDLVIDTGAGTFTIPADTAADGGSGSGEEPATGTAPGLDISVFELFADYAWQERLFFRFGKHTIKWGTGYFFSPADVLNLTAVDAEDPTADREGPVSLRTTYPFGLTGNAYLYLIANSGADILDVAVAPKVEFAVGPGELGIGAYYQRALAPRLVLLGTASWGEVDFFGEGVALWGSDRVFVRPADDQSASDDLVVETYEVDDRPFFQATAGARYLKEWDDGPSLALIGQYFFNGEGYTNDEPDLLPAASQLVLNPGLNASTADDPPALGVGDLANWGRHYAGATVSLSGLLVDDLAFSAFGLVNLTDLSGIVTPAITWGFLERFSLGLSARFTFGEETDEYTDPTALFTGGEVAPTVGLTLDVAMPGGSF